MFNIENFLIKNNIEYHSSGKDVARGNINIQCPFCGIADKSWHMGIKLSRNWYGCWKDSSHRGKDISYLIAKILNCSLQQAKIIVYDKEQRTISERNLLDSIKMKFSITSESKSLKEPNLSEFDTFKTILPDSIYFRYLINRGFDNISLLIDKYNLKYSSIGNWKGKIIFPVYIDRKLVTWQGRDITSNSKLKYKDLSKEKSVRYLKQCIYNFDSLTKGGKVLYITEGVIDALKVGFYTPSDISSTCLFTKTVTQDQYKLLFKVIGNFDRVKILLDVDARKQAYLLKGELLPFHKDVTVIAPPDRIKDAGGMNKEQIRRHLI